MTEPIPFEEIVSAGPKHGEFLARMKAENAPSALVDLFSSLPEIFHPDSDRARVLVIGSLVDTALEDLLRWKFMQAPEVTKGDCDFLLIRRPLPPLGSFGIRARIAFVLGLIDKKTYDGVNYLIEVRNKCAHNKIPPKITKDMGDHIYQFVHTIPTEPIESLFSKFEAETNITAPESAKFLAGCFMIYVEITGRISP